jgi:poly(beta-D-mannuronate) lyase
MKTKTITNAISTLVCATTLSFSYAASITINNSGFEDSWNDWTDVDPTAISSDAFAGSKSAKITGSSGSFSQSVSVSANTQYQLTAQVKGKGTIGVSLSAGNQLANADSSNWTEASLEFNSGSQTSITIFGQYGGGEGRFDAFTLDSISTPTDPGNSETCTSPSVLPVLSASDDGTNDGHLPSNTVDNNLSDESRWSSKGAPKWILYDLGTDATVTDLSIAFYKGNTRSSYFYVETSLDKNTWTSVFENGVSGGQTTGYENFDIADSDARYVRITGNGNNASAWNSIIETQINGCSDGYIPPVEPPVEPPVPGTDLDPSLPPSGNFELNDWYVSIPTDTDGSGTADSIKETALSSGYENSEYFYTGSDGGMVFRCPISGYKTSTNTSYTRTELREMLRRGDTNIDTQGVNKNNWVFGSTSSSAQSAAGGVDGTLTATLAVNHVTTTGDSDQVGRVIVGQIHANNDEPLRLYYRKLPGNSNGSIYFAHEPNGGSDQWYELIGSRSDSASNPSDGIALNERFGYSVVVSGNSLTVTISRDGKPDVSETVDMSNSGYDDSSQYQYFKAGVYNQNNTGDADDYVQATFYSLVNKHTGYSY